MWSAPSSTILITKLQHNQPVVSFVTLAWVGAVREHMKFLELIQTKWGSRMSNNSGMSIGAQSEYNTQGNSDVTDLKNIHTKLKVLYITLIRTNNL
jgi:hypothetical protein